MNDIIGYMTSMILIKVANGMVSSIMSPEDKRRPSIASTCTALDFRTKVILFCLEKDLSMKHVEALESINASVASLLGPNQIGTIKQEAGLANSMGPDFVVLRFDSRCMVPIVTGRLRFPNVSLLFSYKKSADALMGSYLLGNQVDRNRGIKFLYAFASSLVPSMV